MITRALLVAWLTLVWVLFGALGCGSLIVIALSLFSLRTVNYPQAAALSATSRPRSMPMPQVNS